jgi:hypothetical protein
MYEKELEFPQTLLRPFDQWTQQQKIITRKAKTDTITNHILYRYNKGYYTNECSMYCYSKEYESVL